MNGLWEGRSIELQREAMQFGHADRKARYERVMSLLDQNNCSVSFPFLFKDQYQLKGFYRFINNSGVTHSSFLSGYQQGLIRYAKEQTDSKQAWLLIQDTMLTDYNSRALDLGYTQTEKSNGFLLHHGLLLDEGAIPLGLLHQQVIHRERKDFGKARLWNSKPTAEKESNKWIEALTTGVAFSEATGRSLIHIMDREADIIDVINYCNRHKEQYFIIRARHDRSTLSRHQKDKAEVPELFRLFHLMRSLPQPSSIRRTLRDEKGKSYEADCHINYHHFYFRDIAEPVTCVWVRERVPAEGKPPAEWFLLTSLPVANPAEAEQIAGCYSKRWIVEDFHKCYKTGCSIEERQFDSRKALTTTIGMLALQAVILLRTSYYARQQPDTPFETVITDRTGQQLAKAIAATYLKPMDEKDSQPFTILWWILLLGRMGGHQGIRQKGLPGWQTLWKGYAHFQSLLTGFRLAHNSS
jgi:hypothetical protein